MRIFIVSLLFVLGFQTSLFVTLKTGHLLYALLISVCISGCIKFENTFIAKELKKNINPKKKEASKIIPIITKEIERLQIVTIKNGVET